MTNRAVDLASSELVALLDHLPAMVALWDEDRRNRFANRAYVEWFGIAPEDMQGMHIKDLLGPKIYAMNLPYIEGALAGEPQLFERVLVDTLGQTRHSQASYTPYVIDGVVRGFFVLVVDISARVEAEAALLKATEEVAVQQERERVATRLNELVVQRLYATSLQLSATLQPGFVDIGQRVTSVVQSIDDAIRDLRSSIFALRPPAHQRT